MYFTPYLGPANSLFSTISPPNTKIGNFANKLVESGRVYFNPHNPIYSYCICLGCSYYASYFDVDIVKSSTKATY